MQTTVTKKSSVLLSISVKTAGSDMEKARKHVIDTIRKEGKVRGFRKGSDIPESVIMREFGEDVIDRQAVDSVIEKIYPKILQKEKIVPVAPGNVTELKSMDPLEFTIEVEIFPEITIDEKKLDKIRVKRTPITVTESEIDDEINAIKTRFTHYHTAGEHTEDGADTSHTIVEPGDQVTISAEGYDKKGGAAISETAVPHYPIIIGSGMFIPGFEEKLIGAKSGDTIEFDITFPVDYHSADFQGKKVYFVVDIEKIEKPHTPEFTPDFIEQIRGKKTDLAGFREIIRTEIEQRKSHEARNRDEDALMNQLLEIADIEIGPSLLSNEIENVYREHASYLEQQGLSIKQYLEHTRIDEDTYKNDTIRPEAERRIRAELLLRKIRELKHIEPSDAEVTTEIEKVIAEYQNPDVVKRLHEKLVPGDIYYEDIKNRLAYRKVVDTFWE